ncbi:MAG: TolC family protein [Bacteroidetes bacterium]|nr:TolC family protein [Bacteroidota bacterium]
MFLRSLLVFISLIVCFALPAQVRTLDFFVTTAIDNSPLIKDYQGQIRSATIDSTIINASRKPQVDAIGMVMAAPSYKYFGYDGAVTNTGNYEAVASVSQPLFAKKIYAPQYEEIRIGNEALNNSSQVSAHDIRKDVTDQFINAYSTYRQYTYNSSLLKLLDEEEPLLAGLVTNGIYRQTDYLAFELEKKTQQVAVNQLYVQYRADLGELNVLCGITDTAYYELSSPSIMKEEPQQGKISPFIFQFTIDSMRIVNQHDLIDAHYRSHLNWFADAGLLSSRPATMYRNFGFSFGISFVMPLYDGHQRNMQYQKLAINENIRMNYRNYFNDQQRTRVLQLRMQIVREEELIAQQKDLLKTSQQLIDADKILLGKGQASITDYILAIKNQIDIQAQLNAAEVTQFSLINQLNYWNW